MFLTNCNFNYTLNASIFLYTTSKINTVRCLLIQLINKRNIYLKNSLLFNSKCFEISNDVETFYLYGTHYENKTNRNLNF